MISLNLIGRVGKGGASIKAVGDRSVLAFSVAADSGFGAKKKTEWFDCSLWGQRGEKLVDYIQQGDQIGVTGNLSTREHDGKTYLQIDVQDVTLIGGKRDDKPARSEGRSSGGRAQQPSNPQYDNATTSDDFDDTNLPF